MKFIEIAEKPFHQLHYRSSGRKGKICEDIILPFYKAVVDTLPKEISSFVITSDIQGREKNKTTNRLAGEAAAEELALLYRQGKIPVINFIALAGDFYDYPDLHKLGATGDVTSVWNAFAKVSPFVVGVHGNHDTVEKTKLAANTIVLDGTSTNYLGLRIGGVCGIIGSKNRNQRKSRQEFIAALARVTRSKNDLILLHQGPEENRDDYRGDPEITAHLTTNSSSIVAVGHSHWKTPYRQLGKNQALNVDRRLYLITAADRK